MTKVIRLALLGVMTLAAALSHFWISPAMISLRKSLGAPIDNLALTDPLRVQFNDLHQYSVAAMSVALFAGLAVLFLTVRSWLTR
jgi:cytochrome bd-type quinol oxidase subunit 1